jgi:hypothetical protein
VRCACGDDGDDKMDGSAPATDAPAQTSSCCGGGGSSTTTQVQATSASAPSVASSTPPILSPTAIHPAAALPRSHTSSPRPSGNVTPPFTLLVWRGSTRNSHLALTYRVGSAIRLDRQVGEQSPCPTHDTEPPPPSSDPAQACQSRFRGRSSQGVEGG